jgi:hypothetical protein
MARRTPPRKVTYFEPVAPRLARNGVVTVTGGVQRVGGVEPCFMRPQPHLASGRPLRL